MGKKLVFPLALGACLLWLVTDHTSSASDIQKNKAVPIIGDRVPQSFSPFTFSGERFCVIQCDEDSVAWYYPDTIPGNGYALYMNPEMCAGANPYPFKLTGVQLYLYDYSNGLTAVWPVEIRVNVRKLKEDTLCLGQPGTLLYHQTFTIPADSSYDSLDPYEEPMYLSLDSLTNPDATCRLDTTFFLEIIFTGGTDPPFPSLVMSDASLDLPDTCHAWFLEEGTYKEWSRYWASPIPGCPIMRTIGYTNSVDCDPCWYWKPTSNTAPSGMPDFDQYQFSDSSALDVPAAVANCLLWFNAVPQDTNPADLVRLLSTYFGTHPDSGTFVDSIQSGLESCFTDYGLPLRQQTFYHPDFYEMADSLESYQNIVLVLGFWQLHENFWHRFGGHAVTLAGICSQSESLWVALSDPAVDGAELARQGRFFPLGHPSHPEDDTLHNNPLYVSHDIYPSDTLFIDYGDSLDTLWRVKELYDADTSLFSRFEAQNFQPGQMPYLHSYESSEPVHAVVEYAIMICPKPTAVEEEEQIAAPGDFRLFQSHPNPFNSETIIKYTLSRSCRISLVIYNILGQKVRTLVTEYQKPGVRSVSWDGTDENGKDLASGIYFYQLTAGEIIQTKRMILLK